MLSGSVLSLLEPTNAGTNKQPEYFWENFKDKPFAAPFSDGVWWDPKDKLFKMWYLAGTGLFFGYATSTDGIHSKVADDQGRPKINHVTLGYSRDGFHWYRPDRRAFLNVSEDKTAWNWGNVQSAGGGCLVVGDKLYFYCSGRNSGRVPDDGSGGTTGLAVLRRDGFASMDADVDESPASLTTRPVRFSGKHLFVNVAAFGSLRVAVLDAKGEPIAGFSENDCRPIQADSTLTRVTWNEREDLSSLAGKPVRFRFTLYNGQLYSFWVSPDENGASYGYVAAGGPGLTSNRDTVGSAIKRD